MIVYRMEEKKENEPTKQLFKKKEKKIKKGQLFLFLAAFIQSTK